MLAWFVATFRSNAELAIFLALAIGYFAGPLRIGAFTLGNVTACLLAGVLVGQQLNVEVPGPIKAFFFLLFLFAVGYRVGPQFFSSLRRDGVSQVVFAVVAALLMLAAVAGFATAVHFNVGQAAGLLAGSLTQSAAIGTATDALARMNLDPNVMKVLQNQIAVGYAVAYVFSTITGVLLCTRLVPMLFRFDLVEECKKLEVQLGRKPEMPPGIFGAYAVNAVRAVRVSDGMAGKTIGEVEREFGSVGHRVFVAAIRRGGAISPSTPVDVLADGDVIALAGPTEVVVAESAGREVHDPELLDIPFAQLDVVVTNPAVTDRSVEELMTGRARGVVLKKIVRESVDAPVLPLAKIQRGDTLTIAGFANDVERVAQVVGYAMRPSPAADVVFISLGILIGGLIGTLSVAVGGVPIGLGSSCGALVAGLAAGYLRGRSPTFGNISPGAQWVFDSFALCIFVTIVGIQAGPGFVAGLKTAGVALCVGGVAIPLVSLLIAAVFGKYVLKLNNVILCGALAGADTSSASFGAMQDMAKSNLFTLGYTITYAIGNVLLTVWGTVIVAIFSSKIST